MKKCLRFISILLVILLISGCAPKPVPVVTEETPPPEPTPVTYKNQLTGEYCFDDESKTQLRPVAVAVNNLSGAQKCQTGLENADIIYETYVEGGITRLLAVFKDITEAGEIGSVRSARYNYADLACSHGAEYVHAGVDYTYCQPYMDRLGLDDVNMLENRYYGYAYRIKNGMALEHTLYTTGDKLWQMMNDCGIRTTVDDGHSGDWQSFSAEKRLLPDGTATTVTAAFSGSYVTKFGYDTASSKYKTLGHTDWRSGNEIAVDNVVVLFTSLGTFDDGYRVNIGMRGGSGYYFSNGTYQKINWTKGEAFDSFKFTDESGAPLAYNTGSSWVCMISEGMRNRFTIE